MTFLYTLFLYFLPAVIIPFIISLIFNLNRKKKIFPSLEILESLLSKELSQKKFKMRLKQIIRAIILFLVIISYAFPIPNNEANLKKYTVFIDPTISISRFDLTDILTQVENTYQIENIYFGNKNISSGEWHEKISTIDFSLEGSQVINEISTTITLENPSNILFITDGQKYQFQSEIELPEIQGEFAILLLSNSSRNIYVNNFDLFPAVNISDVQQDISIDIEGELDDSDRITIFLNDEEIYYGQAEENIQFSRFIDQKGISFGKILLEGDDFTNDNIFYFSVISIGTPSVYNDIDYPVIKRSISTIFPDYYYTENLDFADIIIAGDLTQNINDIPVILFCDPLSGIENILRDQFSLFIEYQQNQFSGSIESEWNVLNIINNFKVYTEFEIDFGETIASINNKPLLTQMDNYYIFNFSIDENETYLENSVFLLLVFNEIIMNYYHSEFLIDEEKEIDNLSFYDQSDVLYSGKEVSELSGIFRSKSDQLYYINNVNEESQFEFFDRKSFVNDLFTDMNINFINSQDLKAEAKSINNTIVMITMCLGLLLFIIEAILQ